MGPKALVTLAGRPMLEWSLRAFAAAAEVGTAVIAATPGDERRFEELAAGIESLETEVVTGGASRSESVAAAARQVDTDLVAVHDAARPLVTPELIDELVAKLVRRPGRRRGDRSGAAHRHGEAGPRAPTRQGRDRARRTDGGEDREPRSPLGGADAAGLRTGRASRCARRRPQRLATATDDAWLVEKAGGKVLIHPSPPENSR